MRSEWTSLADAQLLAQCAVDTYRASGPGGQKRNKTSSAVRLRHPPTGLIVVAEESRSQHENRARALRRLRQALYLKVRDPVAPGELAADALGQRPELRLALGPGGRLSLSHKDRRFWPAVGLVLDILNVLEGRLADAGRALGLTTGNLVAFLQTCPQVWGQVNALRTRFGRKPLRSP